MEVRRSKLTVDDSAKRDRGTTYQLWGSIENPSVINKILSGGVRGIAQNMCYGRMMRLEVELKVVVLCLGLKTKGICIGPGQSLQLY